MGDTDESTLRMFFAVVPDGATAERFGDAARALSLESPALPVPHANLHMTLAFVGGVAPAQLALLRHIGSSQRAAVLPLRVDAYEYWPKPEVVVAAARTIPRSLQRLWDQLHGDLAAHQLALDPKRLRPHVTLARKVAQAPVLQAMSPIEWVAREFSLMRSDTGGPQSAYTVVDTWPLLDELEKP